MYVNKDVPELRTNKLPRWGRRGKTILKFIFLLYCIAVQELYFSSRLLASSLAPPPGGAAPDGSSAGEPALDALSPRNHALLRGSHTAKLRLNKIAQYYEVGKPRVLNAMKIMYNGKKPLDPKYVRHILKEGKKILSGLDTIYDMPIPPIKGNHEVHSSQNNTGGSDEADDGKSVVTVSTRLLLILCSSTNTTAFVYVMLCLYSCSSSFSFLALFTIVSHFRLLEIFMDNTITLFTSSKPMDFPLPVTRTYSTVTTLTGDHSASNVY